MKNSTERAKETVENSFWYALNLCDAWCHGEDYTYDFGHIIQVAKLILEVEDRIGATNEF